MEMQKCWGMRESVYHFCHTDRGKKNSRSEMHCNYDSSWIIWNLEDTGYSLVTGALKGEL